MSIESSTAGVPGLPRAVDRPHGFFFAMALVFAAIAFAGFARTYLIPVATGRFGGPALVQVHALLFFGWTILWALQVRLAASGRRDLHRAMGLAAISLATAMLCTSVFLVARTLNVNIALPDARLVALLPLTQILMFAGFFAAGVVNLRKPEVHRRLMLLATVSLLNAPAARIALAFLAPGVTALDDPGLTTGVRLGAALIGALVLHLLIGVAMVHDWRTRGRPHRIYVIGVAIILLVQVLRVPFARTPLWTWASDGLLALVR